MISINDIIDAQLKTEDEAQARERHAGEYYCSELGYCMRQTFYKHKLPKPKKSEVDHKRDLRVFERGNTLHEWISGRLAKAMEEEGGTHQEEVSIVIPDVRNGFVVRGRIDNLLKFPDRYEIIEVKTTARIAKRNMPKGYHVAQLMPYLLYSPNRTIGKLLYLETGSFDTAEYEVHYDHFMLNDLWGKITKIHDSIMSSTLPIAEVKYDKEEKWQCKYCDFADRCEADGDEGGMPWRA